MPVFMTAPQEAALYRGKLRDEYETSQMNSRVKYIRFCNTFTKQSGAPDVKPCGHCDARVYLEGCDRDRQTNATKCPILDSLAVSWAPHMEPGARVRPASVAACPILDSFAASITSISSSSASASMTLPSKKPRLASDTVKALIDAKALKTGSAKKMWRLRA